MSSYCNDLIECSNFVRPFQTLTLVFNIKQYLGVTIRAVRSQLRSKIIAAVTGDRV